MILPTLSFLPYLLALFGGEPTGATVSRVMVHDEMIVRVPVVRSRIAWPVRWVEKKGPKCIRYDGIAAAAWVSENSIDFLMRDRSRLRAKLDSSCPALDFYGGFYLDLKDNKVCARRDEIRNRIGASCQIDRFRSVVPVAAR